MSVYNCTKKNYCVLLNGEPRPANPTKYACLVLPANCFYLLLRHECSCREVWRSKVRDSVKTGHQYHSRRHGPSQTGNRNPLTKKDAGTYSERCLMCHPMASHWTGLALANDWQLNSKENETVIDADPCDMLSGVAEITRESLLKQ